MALTVMQVQETDMKKKKKKFLQPYNQQTKKYVDHKMLPFAMKLYKLLCFWPHKIYLASERRSGVSAFQRIQIADLFSHNHLHI